ncbi:transglutaminase domain-containing protein [Cuneatibacter caecimuris]|uniref:Transglutaminase superfamily protein n=1 Tax=Cuneatibacter caecimuris TaxID=1796618 RepID=A0A4Q7PP55_9FIRM|nr:transglutaminase domain-containing protein [Cuneatibacter caecimuris]RZT02684.1 transglutaminase superfamily protein [Cuneatibacter caecimuris]
MKRRWRLILACCLCSLALCGCSAGSLGERFGYGLSWMWAELAPEYATYPDAESGGNGSHDHTDTPDAAEGQPVPGQESLPGRAGQERLARQAAAELVQSVVQPGSSQYEQEKAVHDELIRRIKYDSRENLPDVSHTAYGALVLGTGVCDAYAYAFAMCMDSLGITNRIVTGTAQNGESAQPHAWNMVQLDGEWYHVDVTWDDTEGEWVSYEYFNITTEAISRTHRDFEAPAATAETYNYYLRTGLLATDETLFVSKAQSLLEEGKREITLYCRDFQPDQALVETFIWDYCGSYAMNWSFGGYIYTVTITLQ